MYSVLVRDRSAPIMIGNEESFEPLCVHEGCYFIQQGDGSNTIIVFNGEPVDRRTDTAVWVANYNSLFFSAEMISE